MFVRLAYVLVISQLVRFGCGKISNCCKQNFRIVQTKESFGCKNNRNISLPLTIACTHGMFIYSQYRIINDTFLQLFADRTSVFKEFCLDPNNNKAYICFGDSKNTIDLTRNEFKSTVPLPLPSPSSPLSYPFTLPIPELISVFFVIVAFAIHYNICQQIEIFDLQLFCFLANQMIFLVFKAYFLMQKPDANERYCVVKFFARNYWLLNMFVWQTTIAIHLFSTVINFKHQHTKSELFVFYVILEQIISLFLQLATIFIDQNRLIIDSSIVRITLDSCLNIFQRHKQIRTMIICLQVIAASLLVFTLCNSRKTNRSKYVADNCLSAVKLILINGTVFVVEFLNSNGHLSESRVFSILKYVDRYQGLFVFVALLFQKNAIDSIANRLQTNDNPRVNRCHDIPSKS